MAMRQFQIRRRGAALLCSVSWLTRPTDLVIETAPAPPSGLELGASSIKFQPGNLTAAGQTSVLRQATSGLTNVLTSDGSFLAARVYIDFDRMLRNDYYPVLGNAGGPGKMQLMLTTSALGSATLRGRFYFVMNRSSGSQYVVLGGTMPEVSGWYDVYVKRDTGGVFKIDVYRVGDGTKVSDGASNVLTQSLGGVDTFAETAFYIGDAQDVSGQATTSTARTINGNGAVGFEGTIAWLGVGTVAVTETDCAAIAGGADLFTRMGASNFKYARRFGMNTSGAVTGLGPVAGSGDTTGAATVIGSFLPGGTPGRQGASDYITLDPVNDYRGFAVHPTTKVASVPFAGLCGGVSYSGSISALWLPNYRYRREVRFFGGQVQGRFIGEDGVPVGVWQTVQAISAPGVTNGRTFTENSRSAPAAKVLINGQSQMTIFCGGTSLNNTLADPAVSVARWEQGTNNAAAFRMQTLPDVGNLRVSDGVVEMAKTIRAANGGAGAVQIVLNALQGTDPIDMIDNWQRALGGVTLNTLDLLAYAGNDISVDLWQWFSSRSGEGANFGTNVLDAVYNGTGPNAVAGNTLPAIRSASARIAISPATRETVTASGPLDTDGQNSIGALRAVQRSWAAANGAVIGPEIPDMRLDSGNGPHQLPSSVRGNVRLGIRLGETVARALGLSARTDPTLGSPRYVAGKAAFTLTATLPNAGSSLRVDDTATYASNIQGFEISTNFGSTWSRSGFTVTRSGSTITVTRSSGNWSALAAGALRVRYAVGGPWSYGTSLESTELYRGGLYDGTALEGGLGLPFVPMQATVVAEP